MTGSRTKKSIKNVTFSVVGYFITIVCQFLSRSIFVKVLTNEYLGLNGLFSNVLSMLALSELGIGTAMAYALYKPVADNNISKIKSLMKLYKKLYNLIGCFILLAGALLTPFLHLLIAEMPDIKYIRVYYLLYVINTGVSYFYTYKRTLLVCDQNAYISSATTTVASIATRVGQILVLLLTNNYFLYLVVQIVATRIENVWISSIADKKYPYLKEKDVEELTEEDKRGIKENVNAMLFHKIGYVIVMATDNLIISKILGLGSVGLYSNYSLIVDNISSLTDRGLYSVSASVGDLAATGDLEKSEKVFYRLLFVNFWLIGFCSICLFCLFQPFISLWLGDKYLLSINTVIVIVLCFYFNKMRNTVLIFKEATGVLKQDKYAPVVESIINLLASIPLTICFGVTGVKLGTLISTLLVPFWYAGFALFKFYFKKGEGRYLRKQCLYFVVTCLCAACTFFACTKNEITGIAGFVIDVLICCLLPNFIIVALFFKTDEFAYFLQLIKRLFKKA